MARIIVERPRLGGHGYKEKKIHKSDFEDLPCHESMSKHYGWASKELNENLAPLKRYLHSQIGRPWDKVHSEISKHIKLNSAVQRHILQHLEQMIETKTFLGNDGKVYARGMFGDSLIDEKYSSWCDLYVHPKTRLVRKIAPKKHIKEIKETRRVDVGRFEQYHKINGVWYSVSLKEIPKVPLFEVIKSEVTPVRVNKRWVPLGGNQTRLTAAGQIEDHLLKRQIGYCVPVIPILNHRLFRNDLMETYGRKGVYSVSKHQLNSKELRKASLKNDQEA
jgi:hypothetical protein